jgi:N-methylhydantoinase A
MSAPTVTVAANPVGTAGEAGRWRIGVDIGGTFTDFVMLDVRTGQLHHEKVLTTPHDPSIALLDGIGRLLAAHGADARDVIHVIHGTTLVANALIERKGVPVALLTTRGFADVPEIGLEWRYDTYDLQIELPAPLAPRERRFEVDERIAADGSVLRPLDEASVREAAARIRASGAQAVAVCLLHAFRNPVHERRVADLLRAELPGLVVCTSSDVVPEIGEYERMSTVLANAYVLPIFDRYLAAVGRGLRGLGIDRPLYLMLSDGGTVHESTAIRHPIRLVQSGPAGGVEAAMRIGASAGASEVLCFDMGGTTAKACLIDGGEPLRTTEFEVARVWRFRKGSGLPLRIPVIDMIEIGAGGGSIARVDRLGLLQVGPDSASAAPGPACYGLGGREPTVTDADLVLGFLGADSFLGGDMRLDVAAARDAIAREIGEPLGLSVEQAAWGIHELVNENMARAAAIHALEKARRIGDYAMVPIGGAGPVHAAHIAMKLGVRTVICPPGAGVASAYGFLAARTAFSFVRGRIETLDALDFASAETMLGELEAEGRELLATAGVEAASVEVTVEAAMRYVGQGYEIDVPVPRAAITTADADAVREAFAATYRRLFGRTETGVPLEVVSWRLSVLGPRPAVAPGGARSTDAGAAARSPVARGTRPACFGQAGAFRDTPVYGREAFLPGSSVDGPALIEERESTVVVPPGARVRCDVHLNLVVELLHEEDRGDLQGL